MSWGLATEKWPSIAIGKLPTTPVVYETNLSVSSRQGTTITAHVTPHTKGTYTTLIASLAADTYGLWISIQGVGVNATSTGMLLDIATGAAASESVIIANLNAGNAGNQSVAGIGKTYYIPGLLIAAGTRISACCQAVITVDVCTVAVFADESMSLNVQESTVVTYGANTATSFGVSTPSANGAFGAWTEIGTTSRDHSVWTVGLDGLGDTTFAQTTYLVEIGHGANSGAVTTSGTFSFLVTSGNEEVFGPFPGVSYSKSLSGTKVWARIAGIDTEARGIIIYGV